MGDLHIAGFEVPVAREGAGASSEGLGGGGFGVTGQPLGGDIAVTERFQGTTPMIPLATAIALESLCRRRNGSVWHCDNSVYSASSLAMTDTPTFQNTTVKLGTHSIQVNAAAGDVDVCTVNGLYTVAAWTKVGAGSWEHHILRSDGAKWEDGVRNDSATLQIQVSGGVFQLLDDAGNATYFDELVWLNFEIADDWGADWPLTEVFSDLPGLDITGDLLGGYRINDASARAEISHVGYCTSFSGKGAQVQLDIWGPERVVDA